MATAFGGEIECFACDQLGEDTTAKALNEKDAEKYKAELKDDWENLPPIEDTVEYAVYKLSSTKNSRHHFLLFVCKSPKYKTTDSFTIELHIVQKDGERRYSIIPKTKIITSTNLDKYKELGTIFMSADEIIERGLQCLTEFGDYNRYSNNCQDFCKKLAKELGLSYPWTDFEKGVNGTLIGLGVFGAIGMAVGAALAYRGSKKE